jgi:hypothetical protein
VDPAYIGGGVAATLGTVYLAAVFVPSQRTVTSIWWGLNVGVTTPTSAQNWVGLYSSAGTLLASTDVTSVANGTGPFQTSIASTAVSPGFYWVGFLFNGVTAGQPYRLQSLNGSLANLNLPAASKRFATNGTGQTTLSSITPSSNSTSQISWFVAIS